MAAPSWRAELAARLEAIELQHCADREQVLVERRNRAELDACRRDPRQLFLTVPHHTRLRAHAP